MCKPKKTPYDRTPDDYLLGKEGHDLDKALYDTGQAIMDLFEPIVAFAERMLRKVPVFRSHLRDKKRKC